MMMLHCSLMWLVMFMGILATTFPSPHPYSMPFTRNWPGWKSAVVCRYYC